MQHVVQRAAHRTRSKLAIDTAMTSAAVLVVDVPGSKSVQLDLATLRKLEPVDTSQITSRLAGCTGATISSVLSRALPGYARTIASGDFVASDGVQTDPIPLADLEQGVLVHSQAGRPSSPAFSVTNELPPKLGGPLRVVYPDGCAVQSAVCGTPKPVNLKGVVKLQLHAATPEQQWANPANWLAVLGYPLLYSAPADARLMVKKRPLKVGDRELPLGWTPNLAHAAGKAILVAPWVVVAVAVAAARRRR